MIVALALVLSCAGFVALALAMDRHHKQFRRRVPSRSLRLLLRAGGVAGLGAGFAACIVDSGWSNGSVLWFGILSAAALSVAMGLTYGPRDRQLAVKASPQNDRATLRSQAESLH